MVYAESSSNISAMRHLRISKSDSDQDYLVPETFAEDSAYCFDYKYGILLPLTGSRNKNEKVPLQVHKMKEKV